MDVIAFVRSQCRNNIVVHSRNVLLVPHFKRPDGIQFSLPISGIWPGIHNVPPGVGDWITPFPWFITKSLVRHIHYHGFKFVPGGNVFTRSRDNAQIAFARMGAHALSTFDVKRLVQLLA